MTAGMWSCSTLCNSLLLYVRILYITVVLRTYLIHSPALLIASTRDVPGRPAGHETIDLVITSFCPYKEEQMKLWNLHCNCKAKYKIMYLENETAILHLTSYDYQSLSFQDNEK